VLLELLGGTGEAAPLSPRHAKLLDDAHAAAAAAITEALGGGYGAEAGGTLDAELRKARPPPAAQLTSLLADPSLLLEGGALRGVPPHKRPPRTACEAACAAVPTFMLLRQLRASLLHAPDGLASLAPPPLPDLRRGARLHLDKTAQLLPCELRTAAAGIARDAPLKCRLVLPLFDPTEPPLPAGHDFVRRSHLLLVTLAPLGELPPPPPPTAPPPPLPASAHPLSAPPPPPAAAAASAAPATSSAAAAAAAAASAAAPAVATAAGAEASAGAKQASVVLALPLSAVSVTRPEPTSASLRVQLKRPLPAHGQGSEYHLSLAEPWRCSIAKAHLGRASAAARNEQRRRLAELLLAD